MLKAVLLGVGFAVAYLYTCPAHADSTQKRKKSPISLNYQIIGDPFLTIGTSLAYSFSSSFELSLNASKGSNDLRDNFVSKDELELYKIQNSEMYQADGNGVLFSLIGRFYIGNSASIMIGSGYRKFGVTISFLDKEMNWSSRTAMDKKEYVTILGLGNQWSFDSGLNLGIDWAVSPIPYRSETTHDTTIQGLTADQQSILKETLKKYSSALLQSSNPWLAMFTIGFRF